VLIIPSISSFACDDVFHSTILRFLVSKSATLHFEGREGEEILIFKLHTKNRHRPPKTAILALNRQFWSPIEIFCASKKPGKIRGSRNILFSADFLDPPEGYK